MNNSLKTFLFLLITFSATQVNGLFFNSRFNKKSVAAVLSAGLVGKVLYHENGWRQAQKQIAKRCDEVPNMAYLGLRNPQLAGEISNLDADREMLGFVEKRDKRYKFALISRLLYGSLADAVAAVDQGAIKVKLL